MTLPGAGFESYCRVTGSFRRLAQDSEQPSRLELSIAVIALYAIVVGVLAGEVLELVHDAETNTPAPYSRSLRTHDV